MRGKRDFTKHITHMPSGRWTWNVLDSFSNHVAGGLARSYRDARRKATEAERALLGALQPAATQAGHISPAFSYRNQAACQRKLSIESHNQH